MNYTLDKNEDLVVFHIKDKNIEGSVSAKYKGEFLIFCQPELKAFIIDLSIVESIDSAGFGALLLSYRQLKEHGVPVILTGVNEYIKSLMDMTQIANLFEYQDTVDDALKDLN